MSRVASICLILGESRYSGLFSELWGGRSRASATRGTEVRWSPASQVLSSDTRKLSDSLKRNLRCCSMIGSETGYMKRNGFSFGRDLLKRRRY